MADTISWSFNAAATSGATSKASGKITVDAVFSANRTLKKSMANAEELKLQLETPAKIGFLAITSSNSDAKVKIKATGAEVAMTGPLLLYGDALALFATDLTTLTVKNTATEPAELSILVGLNLV